MKKHIEKVYGVGVISASDMARIHMRGIKNNTSTELRAIWDIDIV